MSLLIGGVTGQGSNASNCRLTSTRCNVIIAFPGDVVKKMTVLPETHPDK